MRTKACDKAIVAVSNILDNLRDSNFVGDHGRLAVDGLQEYAADLAVDIFRAFKGEPTEQEQEYICDNA